MNQTIKTKLTYQLVRPNLTFLASIQLTINCYKIFKVRILLDLMRFLTSRIKWKQIRTKSIWKSHPEHFRIPIIFRIQMMHWDLRLNREDRFKAPKIMSSIRLIIWRACWGLRKASLAVGNVWQRASDLINSISPVWAR